MADTTKQLYEIQHFGHSAEQISTERQYFLKLLLNNLLDPVLKKLTTSESIDKLLVEPKAKAIENIRTSFQPKLREIEALDVETFSIPDNVLLGQDLLICKNLTDEDEQRLDAEVAELKQQFLENAIIVAALEVENKDYESIAKLVLEEVALQTQVQEAMRSVDLKKTENMLTYILKK